MNELTVAIFTAMLVAKIVERLRKDLIPGLDGVWVNLLASALGIGIAFAAGFDILHSVTEYAWPWWIDRLITGFAIGAGSGWLSDIAGRSGDQATKPSRVIEGY